MNSSNLFNNEIEMGLRILVILKSKYPISLDAELINYYSYFLVHSKDLGDSTSLHPDIPNRFGELLVKTELINNAIKMLISRGLIIQRYSDSGLEYVASESTAPFLDNLEEEYLINLANKANWVSDFFSNYSSQEVRNYVYSNKHKWGSEISYCTQELLDE